MRGKLRRFLPHNRELRLAIGLAILALVISFSPAAIKQPLSGYTYVISLSPFQGVAENIRRLTRTEQTNRLLRKQLQEIELALAFAREALEQNARLRDSLGFKAGEEYRVIPGDLKDFDPRRKDNAVIVSTKGNQPLDRNMAVVSLQGLVGKTSNVMGGDATVELLTSPNCRVAARDQNTRALGIIKWKWGDLFYLDNVPVRDSVNVGDTIVSSGLGGIFPAGLPIGVIQEVDLVKRGFFQKIKVIPFVDFNRLDEVFILRKVGY